MSRFDLLRCLINAEATMFYFEIPFYFGSKRAASPCEASNSRYPGSAIFDWIGLTNTPISPTGQLGVFAVFLQ